ncbi:winged helix-turn-helix domain-containing protein [Aliarcobacter cryaerophilus]|uniref:winged helix-turn-helix domain-containing protein n=1 Tax=Aliarcobacter cryaerophilus TaxID=28198 RepID=UPI0036F3B7C9
MIKNGEKITLTKNEVLFLELLLEKPNHLISKNIIENSFFKASVDENTLRNMVYRLRKKLILILLLQLKIWGI